MIPPASALCPECGLKSAFAKFTINDCLVDKVGVINLPIVTVTVLFNIAVSVSSICPVSLECLKDC